MSHVVVVEADSADQAISNLHIAGEVAKRMGGELVLDQKTYKWFERHMGDFPLPEGFKVEDLGKCEHMIKFDDVNYQVGLVASRKFPGTYGIVYDFFDRQLNEKMGQAKVETEEGKMKTVYGTHFMQLYQVETAKYQAQIYDHNYMETEDEEGNIYVEIDTTNRMGY